MPVGVCDIKSWVGSNFVVQSFSYSVLFVCVSFIISYDFMNNLQGFVAAWLCGFSKDDGVIPVNKNLWSLSFVLALASMAFFLQCVLYVIVDVKNWWNGNPLYFAGKYFT